MPSLCHDFLPVLATDALRAGPLTGILTVRQLLAADITARLVAIQAPTLLVWGARDTLIPLRVGGALAARLPDARVVIIPEVGHNPMWERAPRRSTGPRWRSSVSERDGIAAGGTRSLCRYSVC